MEEYEENKKKIYDEFVKYYEYVDEPSDIYNLNSFYQMNKKNGILWLLYIPLASLIGGYAGQFIMLITFINENYNEAITSEKV